MFCFFKKLLISLKKFITCSNSFKYILKIHIYQFTSPKKKNFLSQTYFFLLNLTNSILSQSFYLIPLLNPWSYSNIGSDSYHHNYTSTQTVPNRSPYNPPGTPSDRTQRPWRSKGRTYTP